MILTPSQQDVLDSVVAMPPGGVLVFSGAAGTGKSTVVRAIVDAMPGGIIPVVCAPTGRAAARLKALGVADAKTVHGFCYTLKGKASSGDPIFQAVGALLVGRGRWIIIDEASMVGPDMATDLDVFRAKYELRLVFVGDSFQLPPVVADEHSGFNIMSGSYFTSAIRKDLDEVHRQALGSPVLSFATAVRTGAALPSGFGEGYVDLIGDVDSAAEAYLDMQKMGCPDTVAITWSNEDRHRMNASIRRMLGHTPPFPQPGEPVVALVNAYALGLMNGEVATVEEIVPRPVDPPPPGLEKYALPADFFKARSDEVRLRRPDGTTVRARLVTDWLGKEPTGQRRPFDGCKELWDEGVKSAIAVDWGYCLTAHKSQGSEWENAIVYLPSWAPRMGDFRRWLYTASTRASKGLLLVHGAGIEHLFSRRAA